MENENKRPKVGVGVWIVKDGKVLLGKRKNAHGNESWAAPGGHLEWFESPEECALREVAEEAGIEIVNLRSMTFTNDVFLDEDKHYITLAVVADYVSGEPQVLEPDKCERWEWFSWDELPEPRFLPLENLLKQGFRPR
ncbi:NUDIX domain-containing protein [Candidatus Uhrbacteria bacterium]|nr:NUDIX domain-containing protein [Candidatus Uhrbacteria bacterium]